MLIYLLICHHLRGGCDWSQAGEPKPNATSLPFDPLSAWIAKVFSGIEVMDEVVIPRAKPRPNQAPFYAKQLGG